MPVTDIPLFSMLRTRMHWHQERQRLLAENVSNADTPSYRPRDLSPLKFDPNPQGPSPLTLARTDPGHLAPNASSSTQFQLASGGRYDIRPAGNAVNLEDEMIKVAGNQMDYQQATTLYSRSLALIKTAVGKR
jgi:flagellar basal-body rod protein FlgB